MALGYDPHQDEPAAKRYRNYPEYDEVKKAVAKRLSTLSDQEIKENFSSVRYILGVTHPKPYETVTHTEQRTVGRWPFKKTEIVKSSTQVLRPYQELIRELMDPATLRNPQGSKP